MKLRLLLAAAILLTLVSQVMPVSASSCANTDGYYVASLNGNIDPGSADFMASTVSDAEAACAGHLVLVLTTNGGDGGSMESIIGSISSYKAWGGTFFTLVAPEGAFAFSAPNPHWGHT